MGAVILALVAFTREDVVVEPPWKDAAPIGITSLRSRADDGRSIPVAVWYPAVASGAPRLRVGDYVALADSDNTERPGSARAGLTGMLVKSGAPAEDAERWMNYLLAGQRDAPQARGRFPLVLMVAGNDESAGDQALLAEYLAARGYIVAATAFPTRLGTPPMASESDIPRVATAQVNDLKTIVRSLSLWPSVDTARIAVIGHSFGARSALLMAMQDPAVQAVVSLDGGIGSSTGRKDMTQAPQWNAHRSIAPVLHVYETLDAWMKPDHTLLEGLDSATVWLAATSAMHHHHFTMLGAVPAAYEGVQKALGYAPATAGEFANVTVLVTRFLDAQFRAGAFGAGVVAGLHVEQLKRGH